MRDVIDNRAREPDARWPGSHHAGGRSLICARVSTTTLYSTPQLARRSPAPAGIQVFSEAFRIPSCGTISCIVFRTGVLTIERDRRAIVDSAHKYCSGFHRSARVGVANVEVETANAAVVRDQQCVGPWRGRSSARSGNVGRTSVLEEVIVTAEKRSVNIQEVPVAVSAYTSETRTLLGVNTVEDLARSTPSVAYRNDDRLAIRRIGRLTNAVGTDPAVALYSTASSRLRWRTHQRRRCSSSAPRFCAARGRARCTDATPSAVRST